MRHAEFFKGEEEESPRPRTRKEKNTVQGIDILLMELIFCKVY